jgi:hypothetical protein
MGGFANLSVHILQRTVLFLFSYDLAKALIHDPFYLYECQTPYSVVALGLSITSLGIHILNSHSLVSG